MQVRDAKVEGGGDVAPIPVTVRQLEALVRISESLARMELNTAVGARHVQTAIDLFGASTLDAVRSGMAQSLVLSEEQVCSPMLPTGRQCMRSLPNDVRSPKCILLSPAAVHPHLPVLRAEAPA